MDRRLRRCRASRCGARATHARRAGRGETDRVRGPQLSICGSFAWCARVDRQQLEAPWTLKTQATRRISRTPFDCGRSPRSRLSLVATLRGRHRLGELLKLWFIPLRPSKASIACESVCSAHFLVRAASLLATPTRLISPMVGCHLLVQGLGLRQTRLGSTS